MMVKIFDKFIDKPGSGAEDIDRKLGTNIQELQAVRLVSHSLRLLGVLFQAKDTDWLVLVDYDNTK